MALTNIAFINYLVLSGLDAGFRKWSEHGFTNLHHCIKGGCLKSFEQLGEEFTLPNTDFFRYLQVRNLLWYEFLEPTPIEEFLVKIQIFKRNKKVIGHLYQIFLGMNPNYR